MKLKLSFLLIKNVPFLFWSSPKPFTITPPIISIIFLVIGLTLFGLGEALLVSAGGGVSPWTVLAQGLTYLTGLSLGGATFCTSIIVLICWIPLKQVPGIGTILNAIIIALVLEFLLPYLPTFDNFFLKISQVISGVLITGFGGSLYLIANLGPGPRDGLMTGIQRVTKLPIAWVRSCLELSAIFFGWSLGGNVGFGTVLFALGIGPATAASLYSLNFFFKDR